MKVRIVLYADIPSGISYLEIAKYIRDELLGAGGSRHPEDPLFNGIKVETVKIMKDIQ